MKGLFLVLISFYLIVFVCLYCVNGIWPYGLRRDHSHKINNLWSRKVLNIFSVNSKCFDLQFYYLNLTILWISTPINRKNFDPWNYSKFDLETVNFVCVQKKKLSVQKEKCRILSIFQFPVNIVLLMLHGILILALMCLVICLFICSYVGEFPIIVLVARSNWHIVMMGKQIFTVSFYYYFYWKVLREKVWGKVY